MTEAKRRTPPEVIITIEPTPNGELRETMTVDPTLPGTRKTLKKARGRLPEAREVAGNGISVSIIFEGGPTTPEPEPHNPWEDTLFGDKTNNQRQPPKPHPQYRKTR